MFIFTETDIFFLFLLFTYLLFLINFAIFFLVSTTCRIVVHVSGVKWLLFLFIFVSNYLVAFIFEW